MKRICDHSALIRTCDGCGMVTAIDLDAMPQYRAEMRMRGQTVREVDHETAMLAWKTAGPCKCRLAKSDKI